MRSFNVLIERDAATTLFVVHAPDWPGAHSQCASLDELRAKAEVVAMRLEDGEPALESEFIGLQTVQVA